MAVRETDEQLIRLVREGNEAALETLCARSLQYIRRYIQRGNVSHADVEDLAQEASLGLVKAVFKGRPEGELESLEKWANGFARIYLLRYRDGEYACGRRKRFRQNPSYRDRETPMTSVFGHNYHIDDIEGELGTGKFIT